MAVAFFISPEGQQAAPSSKDVYSLRFSQAEIYDLRKSGMISPELAGAKRNALIKQTTIEWIILHDGLLAEETVKTIGYFPAVRSIKGFAERDDLIWEIRLIHLDGKRVTRILWINEESLKVIGLGFDEK